MISHLIKISVFATSLAVISASGQHPLLAQTFSTNSDFDQAETTDHEIEVEEKTFPNSTIKQPSGISAAPLSTYMRAYTNHWAGISNQSPPRRKIPEPSALIGLIAIASCGVMQHIKIKKD